jgi:hypothetical protein
MLRPRAPAGQPGETPAAGTGTTRSSSQVLPRHSRISSGITEELARQGFADKILPQFNGHKSLLRTTNALIGAWSSIVKSGKSVLQQDIPHSAGELTRQAL